MTSASEQTIASGAASSPSSSSSAASLYQQLDSYAWHADTEFQSGLSAILSSATTPEHKEHLSLRARCFYFARKHGINVDCDQYLAYRTSKSPSPSNKEETLAALISGTHVIPASANTSNEPEPGLKLSYQEIVDLIQTGKPVPGIKEIPDTVLAGRGTSATQSRRRKPWEKDAPAAEAMRLRVAAEEAVETGA